MSTIISATARRTLASALTALALAAALPQTVLAATNYGIWRVDPTKSSLNSGSATLTIEQVRDANPSAGSFIVISNGSVFRVTDATAYDGKGVHQVDHARMAQEGKAVLIGTNARSADLCGFRCQGGLPEPRMTLTFRTVNGAEQQINDMLAERTQ